MMVRTRALGIIVGLLFAAESFAQEKPLPGLERAVASSMFTLKLPVMDCTVPDLVFFLAKHLEVPAGIEYLPGDCPSRQGLPQDEIALVAKTFHDVLDLLVKADPRFYWTETDGVVVIRPLAAWGNKDHFLHRSIARLELKAANVGAAMDAIFRGAFGNGSGAEIMSSDPSRITVSSGPLSMVEALDAVVRAHGRARWHVKYCTPAVQTEGATVWIMTYDDQGLGKPMPRVRDAQGRPINPCVKP
jgi:hypothetical protein